MKKPNVKPVVITYGTAAVGIPVINSTMRSLEISDSDAGMKREILRSLREHYRQMESNKYYAVAPLLDPRFKQRVFSSSPYVVLAKQMLIVAYKKLEDQEKHSATNVTKYARLD